MRTQDGPEERRDEAGFGLVELVVALGLLTVVSLSVLGLTIRALETSFNSDQRTVAANLASQEIDAVRAQGSLDIRDLPLGLTTTHFDENQVRLTGVTANDPRVAWTVTRRSEWVAEDATNGPCDGGAVTAGGSGVLSYLSVQVTVTWPRMNGVEPIRSDTSVTPKVGVYAPGSGNIPVKVYDRTGAPVRDVEVLARTTTATPAVVQRVRTDEQGCAFLAFLPPATYDVVVSKDGVVDKQGRSPGVARQTVAGGQTVGAIVLEVDRSATLDLAAGTPEFPIPCGLPITVNNSGLDPVFRTVAPVTTTCPTTAPPATTTLRTVPGLYPFNDGYAAWLGDCKDSQPASYSQWTGANIAVTPGETSVRSTLPSRKVRLVMRNTNGTPRANLRVFIDHAVDAAPNARCTTTRRYELGPTKADGSIQVTLPFGTWDVRTGTNAGTSRGSLSLVPAATDDVVPFTRSF